MHTELHRLSASELGRAYKNRSVSPVEVARHLLDRIDAVNQAINAFYLVDGERALAAAEASQARWT